MQQPDLYRALGRRIRRRRKVLELSQEQLAARIGMPRTSITHIERGQQHVLVHTLCAVARALGVAVSDLIPDVTERSVGRARPTRKLLAVRRVGGTIKTATAS